MKDLWTQWSVLLLMAVTALGEAASLAGVSFRFECGLFESATCFFATVFSFAFLAAFSRVLFSLAIAWWVNQAGPWWERWIWLAFIFMVIPYALFLYYWVVYRRLDERGMYSAVDQWRKRGAAPD